MIPPAVTILGAAGLGAYTTFSSFAADTIGLAQRRYTWHSAIYAGATVVLGVAAAAVGRYLLT